MGERLEYHTASDILNCNVLKRQENEFSSYLCKQFRKHIYWFLISERFYFVGTFQGQRFQFQRFTQEKKSTKDENPIKLFQLQKALHRLLTQVTSWHLWHTEGPRSAILWQQLLLFCLTFTELLMDAELPTLHGILPQAPTAAASGRWNTPAATRSQ